LTVYLRVWYTYFIRTGKLPEEKESEMAKTAEHKMVKINNELWVSPCGTVRVQKIGGSWIVGKQIAGSEYFESIESWGIGYNALTAAWEMVNA